MDHEASVTPKSFETLKSALAQAKSLEIVLISASMWPVLKTGTKATIEPVTYDDLQPLDFVVFESDQILVCHCVRDRGVFRSATGERTLITRGLANPFFDLPVKESAILGRVNSHRISPLRFALLSMGLWFLNRLGLRAVITGNRSRSSSSSKSPR